MKILFDESVPKQLRRLLALDDVTLVEEMDWKGVKNGRLLQLAEAGGFDVFVTADQNLKHQQNLKGRRMAIVVLPYNRRKWMSLLVPLLTQVLHEVRPGDYIEVPLPPELH